MSTITFSERLPDSCPPEHAKDEPLEEVYRLVASDNCTDNCFKSNAALGLPKNMHSNVDDCRWASCSLFERDHVNELLKLRGLRKRLPYMAKLSLPAGAGKHILSRKGHVDFWSYSNFDMASAVISVEVA